MMGPPKKPDLEAVFRHYGVEVTGLHGNRLVEEWRPSPIKGEWYEVSSLGRVRSWVRQAKGPTSRADSPRILRQYARQRGHLTVRLMAGYGRHVYVHRLVCAAFNGAPPEGRGVARHLDGDPTNNVPANLAWGTKKDNALDAVRHRTTNRGERCPSAKLTWAQVAEIRAAVAGGESQASVRRRYGIASATVCQIVNGRTWVAW